MSLPDWARAYGGPLFAARIRSVPEDFQVTEELGFEFTGDGEHDYLWVEKTDTNTEWLSRQLARFADVPAKDVGFAGLKDRHAVTRQWFSVPRWHSPDWGKLDVEGAVVLDVQRHNKKLRRGAHKANAFRIVLRGDDLETRATEIGERIQLIDEKGVPNYFGEQRFGRNGSNIELANAWASGKRLPRQKRSLAISTIRSYVFNDSLDQRVQDGSWDTLLTGDKANLDGTSSVFDVEEVDDELERRCAELDIHPAGVLIGDGSTTGPEKWLAALSKARVEPGTRSLRLRVSGLDMAFEDDSLVLAFTLGRGAFATAVLREMAETASP